MKTKFFYKAIMATAITVLLNQFPAFGQWSTSSATGTAIGSGSYNVLGTTTNAASYNDVKFFTYGGERMRLIGDPFYASQMGYLALGEGYAISAAYPGYLLDLYQGDVNTSSTWGYRVDGKQMLFSLGDYTSVFGGGQMAAPAATYAATPGYNTFLGYQTYNALVGGSYNTVVSFLFLYRNFF